MTEVTSADSIARLTEAWTALTRAATSPAFAAQLEERSGVSLHRSALVTLWRLVHDGPQRISDLADAVGVDVSTMSRLVRQLERDRLVERVRAEDDLRSLEIRPAPAGLEAHARVAEARTAILAEVMADWSESDRAAFVRFMTRFAEDYVAHSMRPNPVGPLDSVDREAAFAG
jgi:DNA-binding MarR family transcriptional regulator